MSLLTDPAPTTVSIAGAEVPINWDFRVSIRFEEMMAGELPDEEKIGKALELYYPQVPAAIDQAVDQLLWFYAAGKDSEPGKSGSGSGGPIYSFDYDDEYIYSAFLDQYGIDLQDVPSLHWWKFKAMFQGLKSDNRIVEIMGYRSMEISPQMSKEQKQFYRKMKKQFVIPLPQSEREKLSAIEEALLNGGDVSKLL